LVLLGGLFWALALSPAQARSPACNWQPIVNGVRNLRPPADLALAELNCGIADPVDLPANRRRPQPLGDAHS
jgi:hypothetical protein